MQILIGFVHGELFYHISAEPAIVPSYDARSHKTWNAIAARTGMNENGEIQVS